MNWKIVATLIVGALLGTACGASQQSSAGPSGISRVGEEDPLDEEKPKDSAAAAPPATPPKTPSGIAVPENK